MVGFEQQPCFQRFRKLALQACLTARVCTTAIQKNVGFSTAFAELLSPHPGASVDKPAMRPPILKLPQQLSPASLADSFLVPHL
jgi:hypothetical protein